MQTICRFRPRTVASVQRTGTRSGLTLIEMIVAALILSLALMGLVSTWINMMRMTVNTDDRAAGYEIARQVIERAKLNGFTVNDPPTNGPSSPNTTATGANVIAYRFFNANADEVRNDATSRLAASGERYRATTTITRTNQGPSDRPDMTLLTIQVSVDLVSADHDTGQPLYTLETCLTHGGV